MHSLTELLAWLLPVRFFWLDFRLLLKSISVANTSLWLLAGFVQQWACKDGLVSIWVSVFGVMTVAATSAVLISHLLATAIFMTCRWINNKSWGNECRISCLRITFVNILSCSNYKLYFRHLTGKKKKKKKSQTLRRGNWFPGFRTKCFSGKFKRWFNLIQFRM